MSAWTSRERTGVPVRACQRPRGRNRRWSRPTANAIRAPANTVRCSAAAATPPDLPALLEALAARDLEGGGGPFTEPEPVAMDEQMKKELEALGYADLQASGYIDHFYVDYTKQGLGIGTALGGGPGFRLVQQLGVVGQGGGLQQ